MTRLHFGSSLVKNISEINEPVIFPKKILTASPIIWHRWELKKSDGEII
jgi:hypothetical protein